MVTGIPHLMVIIGSLVALATCQIRDPTCDDLPDKTGFLPHPDPTECFKSYFCYYGLKVEVECPAGLFHNKCAPYDSCKPLADLTPNCRCKNCPARGISRAPIPGSERCDEYIMCVEGDEVARNCPEGQSFDKISRTCKDKEIVDCDLDLCPETWDARKKVSTIGFVPSFRNCQHYLFCSEGKKVSTGDCGAGYMYDVRSEFDVNGIKFFGKCIRKPSTISLEGEELEGDLNPDLQQGVESDDEVIPPECFNGDNWTPPILD